MLSHISLELSRQLAVVLARFFRSWPDRIEPTSRILIDGISGLQLQLVDLKSRKSRVVHLHIASTCKLCSFQANSESFSNVPPQQRFMRPLRCSILQEEHLEDARKSVGLSKQTKA